MVRDKLLQDRECFDCGPATKYDNLAPGFFPCGAKGPISYYLMMTSDSEAMSALSFLK